MSRNYNNVSLAAGYTTHIQFSKNYDPELIVPSQTLESYIRENGGVVKFYKDCTLAYGLSSHARYDAVKLAFKQGYKVAVWSHDPINSFRYWKEVK